MFLKSIIKKGDELRNLDLTALRSFVGVVDAGGVTRAAGVLHLTQSAVSMQIKRLEEALDVVLFDRAGRGVALTPPGELLLGYARRMLQTNDEILQRLTATEFEGEIKLGVPHDIIYPAIPVVLKQFAQAFPRMQVRLISAPTRRLLRMFGKGEVDVILTTEEGCGPGGACVVDLPLVWIGAIGGTAWRRQPLPIAFCSNCIFRAGVIETLTRSGVDWHMAVDSELDHAVEAAVSADLAVHVAIEGMMPPQTEAISHGGQLPDLSRQNINLYQQEPDDPVNKALAEMIRRAYALPAALPQLVTA